MGRGHTMSKVKRYFPTNAGSGKGSVSKPEHDIMRSGPKPLSAANMEPVRKFFVDPEATYVNIQIERKGIDKKIKQVIKRPNVYSIRKLVRLEALRSFLAVFDQFTLKRSWCELSDSERKTLREAFDQIPNDLGILRFKQE